MLMILMKMKMMKLSLLLLLAAVCAGESRVGGLYSPQLDARNMCSDCTKVIELLLDMLSHQDTQDLIQGTLKAVCQRLPHVTECVEAVEKHLPGIIKAILSFSAHKEGEVCMILGLCSVQPKSVDVMQVSLESGGLILTRPSTGTSHELQVTPQCTFCLFIIKKIEDMLPKERTEESVVKLLEKICDLLPAHYKQQCDDFLENYGKQLIDALLSTATPHAICMLLHLCLVQNTQPAVPAVLSECELCRRLVILTQVRVGVNTSQLQSSSSSSSSSFLREMCVLHPNTLPGCGAFVQHHAVTLQWILGKGEEAVKACQVFFCSAR